MDAFGRIFRFNPYQALTKCQNLSLPPMGGSFDPPNFCFNPRGFSVTELPALRSLSRILTAVLTYRHVLQTCVAACIMFCLSCAHNVHALVLKAVGLSHFNARPVVESTIGSRVWFRNEHAQLHWSSTLQFRSLT